MLTPAASLGTTRELRGPDRAPPRLVRPTPWRCRPRTSTRSPVSRDAVASAIMVTPVPSPGTPPATRWGALHDAFPPGDAFPPSDTPLSASLFSSFFVF